MHCSPKILYLTKKSYDVTNVFITFEKERHKRIVLEKMALNRKHVRKQNSSGLPSKKFIFRKKVLLIREADEPSAVRWADLNTNLEFRRMTTIVSSLATILFLYLAVAVVGSWSELTTWGSSYLVRAKPITIWAVRKLQNSATDRLVPLAWQYSLFGKKISAFNVIYPQIAIIMVNHEGHHSEGDRQRSLYFKITVFLVVRT